MKDNKYWTTPLHCADLFGCVEIVKALLNKGAKVNVVDKCKRTPLHWVTLLNYVEVVKVLLEKGANPLLRDEHGVALKYLAKDLSIKQL